MPDDDDTLEPLPPLSPEVEAYLAVRREEAKHIDPETAEIYWCYAEALDPYGIIGIPVCHSTVGREYFARRPGSDIWVSISDLPADVRDELWMKKIKGTSIFV